MKNGFSVYFVLMILTAPSAQTIDEANSYYNKAEYKKAINAYKQAARRGENKAICYFNCANAYFQMDSIAQSIVHYQASLLYAPEFFRAHLNLAISYYSLEDYGQCIAAMLRGLELEPQNQKALLLLAVAYQKIHALPQAAVTFESLTGMNAEMEEPYIALGEIYRDLGDINESIHWLSQYPRSGKNSGYVNRQIAEGYSVLKEYNKAIYYLQKSLETERDNKWTVYRVVELQERLGNDLVALTTAQDGLTSFPYFGELAVLAGNLAFKLEQYDKAERYFIRAREHGGAGAIAGLENIRIKRIEKMEANRNN